MGPVSSAEGAGTGPHPRMGSKSSPTPETQTGGQASGAPSSRKPPSFPATRAGPADFTDSLSSPQRAGPAYSTSNHTLSSCGRDCYSRAPWAPRPVGDAGQQQRRLHHCRRRSCSSRHLERQSRLPAAVLHFHFSSAPRKLQNPWLAPLLARSVCSTGTPLVRAGPSSWAPSLVTRGTGRPGLPLRKVVAGTVHTTVCGVWSSGKLHG